jgi:CBS domain containing-hemolysin-like protein
LQIGAYLSWFVQLLIYALFVIAYPISKLLDYMLGESHGIMYRRAELKELVSILGESNIGNLNTDEVKIIKGVLELRDKTAGDIMTPLEDTVMIEINTEINHDVMASIVAWGHSRIPVYKGHRTNIVGMLLVKKLIVLDPEEPVKVGDLPLTYLPVVTTQKPLFDMINEFQQGQSHLAVVIEPVIKIPVGIISLEDLIEELLQEEIIDETDLYINVHTKEKVHRYHESNTDYEKARYKHVRSDDPETEHLLEETEKRLVPEGFGKRRSASQQLISHEHRKRFLNVDTAPLTKEKLTEKRMSIHNELSEHNEVSEAPFRLQPSPQYEDNVIKTYQKLFDKKFIK